MARNTSLPAKIARWVEGPEPAISRLASGADRLRVYDTKGRSLLLFNDQWTFRHARENSPGVVFLDSVA